MLATETTTKGVFGKPKKWDKLGVQLENFIKSNINERGRITKPFSELFREFADTHNTTVSSTSFYYYNNGVREKIFGSNSDIESIEEQQKFSKNDEVDRLIEHIEETLNINVSEESASMIEEMVKDNGVVNTLLSISKAISNYDKLDISYILIKEAKSNLQ